MLEQDQFVIHLDSTQELESSCISFSKQLPRRINLYADWKVALVDFSTSVKFDQSVSDKLRLGIKTNIIEDSIYNNHSLPLLRVITLNNDWLTKGLYIANFGALLYVPVKIKSFDHIKIELSTLSAATARVIDGITTLSLHFMRL